MNFTDYAKAQGCKLLKDDVKFIRKQLQCIPQAHRKAVMLKYIEIWTQARGDAKNLTASQNEGRRAANLWLRHTVDN